MSVNMTLKSKNKSVNMKNSFLSGTELYDDRTNNNISKKRKVLILGSPGVGKSAIIVRFKDDIFRSEYIPTIQEVYKKEFKFNNERVELEIKDLDGQNDYTLFTNNKFALGVNGYILCYSVENQYSFNLVKSINTKLSALVGDTVPKILVANKADLNNKRIISTDQGKQLAKEIGASFLECSARTGNNIPLIFHSILVEINKFESNVDLGTYTCSSLIRYVIRNSDTISMITYIILILLFVCKLNIILAGGNVSFLFRYTNDHDFNTGIQKSNIRFRSNKLPVELYFFSSWVFRYLPQKQQQVKFFLPWIFSFISSSGDMSSNDSSFFWRTSYRKFIYFPYDNNLTKCSNT